MEDNLEKRPELGSWFYRAVNTFCDKSFSMNDDIETDLHELGSHLTIAAETQSEQQKTLCKDAVSNRGFLFTMLESGMVASKLAQNGERDHRFCMVDGSKVVPSEFRDGRIMRHDSAKFSNGVQELLEDRLTSEGRLKPKTDESDHVHLDDTQYHFNKGEDESDNVHLDDTSPHYKK